MFAELHARELDAVGGRALDAVAGEEAVDIDLRGDEGVAVGDAVARPGAGCVGRDYGYVGDSDELLIDCGQAWCEDSVVVCE